MRLTVSNSGSVERGKLKLGSCIPKRTSAIAGALLTAGRWAPARSTSRRRVMPVRLGVAIIRDRQRLRRRCRRAAGSPVLDAVLVRTEVGLVVRRDVVAGADDLVDALQILGREANG